MYKHKILNIILVATLNVLALEKQMVTLLQSEGLPRVVERRVSHGMQSTNSIASYAIEIPLVDGCGLTKLHRQPATHRREY